MSKDSARRSPLQKAEEMSNHEDGRPVRGAQSSRGSAQSSASAAATFEQTVFSNLFNDQDVQGEPMGGLVVNDMRVRGKNTFLDFRPVEPLGAHRSSSAPPRSESEGSELADMIGTSSPSSLGSGQKKTMMAGSSGSSGTFIVREPPTEQPLCMSSVLQFLEDFPSDDDSFARNHDGGTSTFSESDEEHSGGPESAMPAAPASSSMPAAPASSSMPAAPASSSMPAAPASSSFHNLGGNPLNTVPYGPDGQLTSAGSVGHFQGTCQPCTFSRSGQRCRAGINCVFCHFPHRQTRSNKVRPCKAKRDRQKKAIQEILEQYDNDPDAFDMHNVTMPVSIQNHPTMQEFLMSSLWEREMARRWHRSQGQPASSSTATPNPPSASTSSAATRIWL